MPRIKKRAHRRRRVIEYGNTHRRFLLTGRAFWHEDVEPFFQPSPDGKGGAQVDGAAVEAAWRELEDELLPAFIHKNPGRRPWAWWAFDAPEPTRRVLRGVDVLKNPTTPEWVRRKVNFGVIRVFNAQCHRHGVVVESQPAYLQRHGLLTDGESAALGANFEREEVLWHPHNEKTNGRVVTAH